MSALLPPIGGEEVAFLGLGSNLDSAVGDRLTTLQHAVNALDRDERIRVDEVSSVYQTQAVEGPEQDDFYNLALRVFTRYSPRRLLAACQAVEAELGRRRTVRWGPRTIDIDILLYGERVLATRKLEVPHPRLQERAFVLIPLMEVAPATTLPNGTSIARALAALAPVEGVTMIGSQIQLPGVGR